MKTGFALAIATFFAVTQPHAVHSADATLDPQEIIISAEGHELSEFQWVKRPVVVFANSPADPRFVEQMQLINERLEVLNDRDVVVITDTDPAARSAIRTQLRARDFMIVLLSKEGTVVLRKPTPWDVRELSRSIDKLPLRQQEIRDRRDVLRR
ncbi:DUF4174 domain-containing protein [Puniceibacterium sediminis]|uniref:DUF4174 domain-containing protein n=1 Tax=Puniceibacterium sediminis TaxID=1608407 RepID=A0A238XA83_9RHOB|nr:DUF4174 domain-containing protein [Puniceibacterium sediminis]SNR55532.1 protein of unknown function [Puniceibacterium sediminis]